MRNYFENMRRLAEIFILVFTIVFGEIGGYVSLGIKYDSNICSLSDYEMSGFKAGKQDFLIETSDDAIFQLKCGINLDESLGKYQIEGGLSFSGNGNISNSVMSDINIGYSASLRRRNTRLKISGNFFPNSRNRAYIDVDSGTLQWSSYKSISGRVEFRQRIGFGIYLSTQYEYRWSRYNDYFPEYDAIRHGLSISANRYVPFGIGMGYTFYKSDARGYDERGETKASSDETDVSYEEDNFYFSIGYDLDIWNRKMTPSLKFEASHRVYTSTKPYWVDPLHLGRDEWTFDVEPALSSEIMENIEGGIFCEITLRDAESKHNPNISKLRYYEKTTVGLSIRKVF